MNANTKKTNSACKFHARCCRPQMAEDSAKTPLSVREIAVSIRTRPILQEHHWFCKSATALDAYMARSPAARHLSIRWFSVRLTFTKKLVSVNGCPLAFVFGSSGSH